MGMVWEMQEGIGITNIYRAIREMAAEIGFGYGVLI
jgi:hypothetical protein